MPVLQKPPNWNDFSFSDKLKWYAKKQLDAKDVFADKYRVKFILEELNLKGLKYAKVITHVKPIENNTDLDIIVPIEELLKEQKFQFKQSDVDRIFEKIKSPDLFWDFVKDKYNFELLGEDNKPPSNYVVKLNLGWNAMIFVSKGNILKIVNKDHEYPNEYKYFSLWKKHVLQHYQKKIPPKIFMEEFIGYNLKVFEVFCIYGQPRVLSVYYETSVNYENNYLIDFKKTAETDEKNDSIDLFSCDPNDYTYSHTLLEGVHLIEGTENLDFDVDLGVCKKMAIYASALARYFEFIRVDFYYCGEDIYFSECTFKPGALKKIRWQEVGSLLSKFWSKKPEL